MTVVLSVVASDTAPPLRLRPWAGDDARDLALAHRDPLMRRFLASRVTSEDHARRWIQDQEEGWANGTRLAFAIVECGPDSERLAGHIVVKRKAADSAEVGYWTLAEVRGRGVASRSLEVVARWALRDQRIMPLTRIELLHAVDNPASCRVAEKCGFALTELIPAHPPRYPAEAHRHLREAH